MTKASIISLVVNRPIKIRIGFSTILLNGRNLSTLFSHEGKNEDGSKLPEKNDMVMFFMIIKPNNAFVKSETSPIKKLSASAITKENKQLMIKTTNKKILGNATPSDTFKSMIEMLIRGINIKMAADKKLPKLENIKR